MEQETKPKKKNHPGPSELPGNKTVLPVDPWEVSRDHNTLRNFSFLQRKERRIAADAVAKSAGLGGSAVRGWERDANNLSIDSLIAVFRALGYKLVPQPLDEPDLMAVLEGLYECALQDVRVPPETMNEARRLLKKKEAGNDTPKRTRRSKTE